MSDTKNARLDDAELDADLSVFGDGTDEPSVTPIGEASAPGAGEASQGGAESIGSVEQAPEPDDTRNIEDAQAPRESIEDVATGDDRP